MQSVFLFWFFWDWICSASFLCSNFIHREFYFLFLWVILSSPCIYRHQSFIFISSSPSLMATGDAGRIFNTSLCCFSFPSEWCDVAPETFPFVSKKRCHGSYHYQCPSGVSPIHFACYGETVGNTLQDLQKPSDFSTQHIHVNYSLLYGQSWLSHSYDIMYSHLMQV